jgi:hypothetical protein
MRSRNQGGLSPAGVLNDLPACNTPARRAWKINGMSSEWWYAWTLLEERGALAYDLTPARPPTTVIGRPSVSGSPFPEPSGGGVKPRATCQDPGSQRTRHRSRLRASQPTSQPAHASGGQGRDKTTFSCWALSISSRRCTQHRLQEAKKRDNRHRRLKNSFFFFSHSSTRRQAAKLGLGTFKNMYEGSRDQKRKLNRETYILLPIAPSLRGGNVNLMGDTDRLPQRQHKDNADRLCLLAFTDALMH